MMNQWQWWFHLQRTYCLHVAMSPNRLKPIRAKNACTLCLQTFKTFISVAHKRRESSYMSIISISTHKSMHTHPAQYPIARFVGYRGRGLAVGTNAELVWSLDVVVLRRKLSALKGFSFLQ